ncbi:MAG: TAXI family TRAP transporter solute-binding subunit [Alphaproteobacteria bacterium]|nr:TAXI family TRAP transporter solute-binding subunit [Alphaproteobacteria bacterium]
MSGRSGIPRLRAVGVLLGCAIAVLAGAAAAQQLSFFRIGTGSTGGTYFPIGGLLASLISNPPGSRSCDKGGSCGVPGLIAVAQSTEGSVDNINGIAAGEIDSGLSQADVAYWAYTGTGVYAWRGPYEKLRLIANLYPESVQVVVRRDSGIASVADLRGKRVALGAPESGTLVDAQIILKTFGIEEFDLKPFYLLPGPAGDLLRDGGLDAFFLVAGVPTNAISILSEEIEIDLLSVEGEQAAQLIEDYPFFAFNLIPAETYAGTAEVRTLAVGAQWVLSADIDEDIVYGMTRALWHDNSRRLLSSGHPKGEHIRTESALDGAAIPLHPGAERYYREAGLIE